MNDINKNIILKKFNESPKGWMAWLKSKKNENLYKDLLLSYPQVESVVEKIYWLNNNLTEYPKCLTCGKEVRSFINAHKGYHKHCSCTCSQLDSEVRLKNENTNLKKYGVKNGALSEMSIEKRKQTCLNKYGCENPFSSDIIKEKIKETNLEKYGVENPQQNEEIKKKSQKTLIERYGVNCGCKLNAYYHVSKGEKELLEYVKSLCDKVKGNDRKTIYPMELDIFIEDLNLAIEYDGDYWHSLPNMIERDILKNKVCVDKNIKLIRIKESEWKLNTNNIKCYLRRIIDEQKRINGIV